MANHPLQPCYPVPFYNPLPSAAMLFPLWPFMPTSIKMLKEKKDEEKNTSKLKRELDEKVNVKITSKDPLQLLLS